MFFDICQIETEGGEFLPYIVMEFQGDSSAQVFFLGDQAVSIPLEVSFIFLMCRDLLDKAFQEYPVFRVLRL